MNVGPEKCSPDGLYGVHPINLLQGEGLDILAQRDAASSHRLHVDARFGHVFVSFDGRKIFDNGHFRCLDGDPEPEAECEQEEPGRFVREEIWHAAEEIVRARLGFAEGMRFEGPLEGLSEMVRCIDAFAQLAKIPLPGGEGSHG